MTYRQPHLLLTAAMTLVLSACDQGSGDVQVFGGSTDIINNHITMHDGRITIKAAGAPDATVDANGQLSIDGHDIAVNEAQRALLQRYNASAHAMRADAIATGKAGAATAAQAMSAAAGKITGADSADATKDKVEAAAANVKQAAAKICDDLSAMKSAQDELATQLVEFKPYAHALADTNVEKCRKDTEH